MYSNNNKQYIFKMVWAPFLILIGNLLSPINATYSYYTDSHYTEWQPIIEDQMRPFSNITREQITTTFDAYGSHIIIQYINKNLNIFDPKGMCLCNNSAYGKHYFFQSHYKICKSIIKIINRTVTRWDFINFEIVVSLDDIPMWTLQNQDITNNKSVYYPGFGAVRCWNKPSFAIPFMGTNDNFDIDNVEKSIRIGSIAHNKHNKYPPPLHMRQGKVVFKGGHKGCSYERDTKLNFNFNEAFYNGTNCGRNLLLNISYKYPDIIDYNFNYVSMLDQESKFRYILNTEGFGGWADRLYYLLFSDMVTFNQEHPCDQWFEPLIYPYKHYVPVKYDFRDLIGKVIWANNHPFMVENIMKNAQEFAFKFLKQEGILHYMYYLLLAYTKRLTYIPIQQNNTINANHLLMNNYKYINEYCKSI
jgi:hypothetical protein